jgi:4-amino-4-deoxy-L-arabinose transferase-like glycosyltransferase
MTTKNKTLKGRNKTLKRILILLSLSYVFFMLGNGVLSLTNPDEVFYVQTAKEMFQHHSWMTPYIFGAPQFEKPILLYWLLRIGFLASGTASSWDFSVSAISSGSSAVPDSPVSSISSVSAASLASEAFASRFFPALFAAAGVIATYFLARIGFKNERKAFISALVLMSSGLYIGLARTVYTDMIFSVFILLALMSFFWGYKNATRRRAGLVLFFVFSSLAVLTKGPLGFAIPFLVVVIFLAISRELRVFFCRSSALGFLIFLAIALPWYLFVIQRFGRVFTHEFFYNDHIRRLLEAEHPQNDRWYFYPGSAVIGMFPWSSFVLISIMQLAGRLVCRAAWSKVLPPAGSMYLFVLCWILVIFAIFQPAHSKLISYVFPVFPALAIMTGDLIHEWTLVKGGRRAYAFACVSCFTFAIVPLGLIAGPRLYREYLPSKPLVNGLILLFVVLLITMLLLVAKKRMLQCVYLLGVQLPLLFFFGLSARNHIDPYLSGESACRYLMEHNAVENTVLCSKYFARGVHYFTDREVAVIDVGGVGFFSPHPIPYLDTEEEVRGFLRNQPATYCIVDRTSLNHLQRIVGSQMKLGVQTKTGNEYVVRVESRAGPGEGR